MDWLELHIDTNHTGLEPVETMLSALDVDGLVIDGNRFETVGVPVSVTDCTDTEIQPLEE